MSQFIAWIEDRGTLRPAFYDSEIHKDRVPDNAVEIAPARKQELLRAMQDGKRVERGPGGVPRIVAARLTMPARRDAAAEDIRQEAARRIAAISPIWRQLNDQRQPSPEGDARFAAIDAVRAASSEIEAAMREMPAAELETFDAASADGWPEGDT